MRKLIVPLVAVVLIAFSTCSCKNKEAEEKALAIQSAVLPEGREIYFDSTKVAPFV